MEKYFFRCINCGKSFHNIKFMYTCPDCYESRSDEPPKGYLKMEYKYSEIIEKHHNINDDLLLDLLPIESLASFPALNVGDTPLYDISTNLGLSDGNCKLYAKDDSQNPTFSYKDRASALVSAFAKEQGIDSIVAASTGNAGSSIAGICANQNQKAIVFVPASAPEAKLTQIQLYGAELVRVKGTYDQAFDESLKYSEETDCFNRNTGYNPLTVEGKKTSAFELANELESIDRVFVPVGDGVIISGVFKGFEDLVKCGVISKFPEIIAVQSKQSSNLINNLCTDKFISEECTTAADSISVAIPRNFYMARDYISRYNCRTVLVSDPEILKASSELCSKTGLFSEPAGATSYAGFKRFSEIYDNSGINVILLTGSGLKDIKTMQRFLNQQKEGINE